MRGKRAKIIRKAAYMVWQDLVKNAPKLTVQKVYRWMKKQYTNNVIN